VTAIVSDPLFFVLQPQEVDLGAGDGIRARNLSVNIEYGCIANHFVGLRDYMVRLADERSI
jgi:hypothetical protein